jgi:hypothetical protein
MSNQKPVAPPRWAGKKWLASFFLAMGIACGQTNGLKQIDTNGGAWVMYIGDHPIAPKWNVHLEGQLRRIGPFTRGQQSFVRPALTYKVNPKLWISSGYLYAESYRYGDFPVSETYPEHRIYQELLVRTPIKRFGFDQRYRFEERFVELTNAQGRTGDWQYRNRLRAFYRVTIPTPNPKLYVTFYAEPFIPVAPNRGPNFVEQNRAYGAIGIRLNPENRIELGYMHQYIAQRNGRINEHNHLAQITFFSVTPFRR